MNIKHLPQEERPAERAMSAGIGALSNSELIALILHTGTKEASAIELASRLIASQEEGIRGLFSVGPRELMKTKGIGMSKACAVAAAVELGRRMQKLTRNGRRKIAGAEDAAGMFMQDMRYEKKEHFRCALLDTRGHVMHIENISTGELTGAPVHPREVFSPAIRMSAAGVIFAHNHPSGDPTPSDEDIATTDRLCNIGRLLGIRVLDHIIIGDGCFVSMASKGLMEPK